MTLFVHISIQFWLHIIKLSELQIQYSPRRCTGIGLSDGEGMERIWSYLRRFYRMTKEMHSSHRIDILSGALEYYVEQKKCKLGNGLNYVWVLVVAITLF